MEEQLSQGMPIAANPSPVQQQLPEQLPTQQVPPEMAQQPQELVQGMSNDDADRQFVAQLDDTLAKLPEDQKQFLVRYLAPETALALGIILGKPAFDYFNQLADPNTVLLPFRRDEVEGLMASLGNEVEPENQDQITVPTTKATLV